MSFSDTCTPKEKNASLSQTAELSADVSVQDVEQNIYKMLVVIMGLLVFIIVMSFVTLGWLIFKKNVNGTPNRPEEGKKLA